MRLPKISVSGAARDVIFIQGGMGVRISVARLAAAVARWRGAVGTVSMVALDREVLSWSGRRMNFREAARLEIKKARELAGHDGCIALNAMVALQVSYQDSVIGAIEGGVRAILAGAGLPMTLPEIAGSADVALVPIISSQRALELVERRWRDRFRRIPDAVVLEGPLAGGHLGFAKSEDVTKEENRLENLFLPVKKFVKGRYPVIVAGGIWDRADILRWINEYGADGVQLGTRFAATIESGGSDAFKRAYLTVEEKDIAVTSMSPCGLPFRVDARSPGFIEARAQTRPLLCDKGYVLRNGKCPAAEGYDHFCICNVLLSAVDAQNETNARAIYTMGANAWRIRSLLSVNELMAELTGHSIL